MTTTEYLEGIREQNASVLGKAITLIESSLKKDKKKASQLIEKCIPFSGQSIRIGISGTPGVGKSTFIESLGNHLSKENKIAVLAIDPSSKISKGSILGDKTRMTKLANSQSVFIRPSPSKGKLGGVGHNTKETILLCEAAGFNIIFIETVGVGQSESEVALMTDFFIYLTLMENGDQLQFLKKGVLESSDIILINKCDQNKKKCKEIQIVLKNTLKYVKNKKPQTVFTCSALLNTNIKTIWTYIEKLYFAKIQNGEIENNRKKQNFFWLKKEIESEFKKFIFTKKSVFQKQLSMLEENPPQNPKKMATEIVNKVITKYF